MSLFTSRRERRLWTWVAVLVITIYSTLGLARELATVIDQPGISALLFMLGCLIVLVMMITRGLSRKPGIIEILIGAGVFTVFMMVFVRMLSPVERSHVFEYTIVAIFVHEALLERKANGRNIRYPAVMAFLITTLFGVIDECLQLLIPARVFDPLDMLFNAFAAFMAVVVNVILQWVVKKFRRPNGMK